VRIGLVLPGFSANERDWCIPALHNFVRTLARENDVCVFALEYPYRRDRYNFFGATVYALNGQHRGKLYAPRLWSDALAAIFAQHCRSRFDVLHAFWANKAGLIALVAARALRVPMVASVAGGELVGFAHIGYGGQQHWVERTNVSWVLKRANRVTVGSRYLQAIAARWRGDALIAPLGVDTEMFSPRRAAPFDYALLRSGWAAPTKILNVGSLLPVKQQEVLLDAFARLKSNVELDIVGAGERENFLRTRAAELGITNRIKLSGEIAHDLLPQKYRGADIFVQSSLHEAQGMAVLEAASCGLAIAGTPVGVLPEFAESHAAIAASDFDAHALAAAIQRALESHDDLGCRACVIAEQKFSLQAAHARWMEIYRSVE